MATASAEAGVAATDASRDGEKTGVRTRARSIAAAMREPECGKRTVAAPQARPNVRRARRGALVAAALALPGILPSSAAAQSAADHGILEVKYLDYRDWQPGASRMTVRSPSIYALTPVSTRSSSKVRSSTTACRARRRSTTTRSPARPAGVTDYRTAGDVKVTNYFDDWSLGVGGVSLLGARLPVARRFGRRAHLLRRSQSHLRLRHRGRERPHQSAESTTPEASPTRRETRLEYLVGITQALSPTTIVQSNLTYYVRPRLLLRSVQAPRRAPGGAPDRRVAHAIQPVFRRHPMPRCACRIAICTIRSAAIRTRSPRRGSRRCRASGA